MIDNSADEFLNKDLLSEEEMKNLVLHAMSENNKYFLFIKESPIGNSGDKKFGAQFKNVDTSFVSSSSKVRGSKDGSASPNLKSPLNRNDDSLMYSS